ncbi:MAG TPA: OmpH family outer membrane protein [Bacteroidaceae bacterium]|nr:OmpH family outer membrane protein [Bacteroidaceae bacterium]
MRKTCVVTFLLCVVAILSVKTQNKFGYINFNRTMEMMPEYMEAQLQLQRIQSNLKNEVERSEREFNRQYVDFLHNQEYLTKTILLKRQKELQQLMESGIEFKKRAQIELENERKNLLDPLNLKLLNSIKRVSDSLDLDYVVNTNSRSFLHINQERGVDISIEVYRQIGIDVIDRDTTAFEIIPGRIHLNELSED